MSRYKDFSTGNFKERIDFCTQAEIQSYLKPMAVEIQVVLLEYLHLARGSTANLSVFLMKLYLLN